LKIGADKPAVKLPNKEPGILNQFSGNRELSPKLPPKVSVGYLKALWIFTLALAAISLYSAFRTSGLFLSKSIGAPISIKLSCLTISLRLFEISTSEG